MNSYNLPAAQGTAQVKLLGKAGMDEAQGILQRGNEGAGRAGIRQSYRVCCRRLYKAGTLVQKISKRTWTYRGRAGTQFLAYTWKGQVEAGKEEQWPLKHT